MEITIKISDLDLKKPVSTTNGAYLNGVQTLKEEDVPQELRDEGVSRISLQVGFFTDSIPSARSLRDTLEDDE